MDFCILDQDVLDVEHKIVVEDVAKPFLTSVNFGYFGNERNFKLSRSNPIGKPIFEQVEEDIKLR